MKFTKYEKNVLDLSNVTRRIFLVADGFDFGRVEKLKAIDILRTFCCSDQDLEVDTKVNYQLLELSCVHLAQKIEMDVGHYKYSFKSFISELNEMGLEDRYTPDDFVQLERLILKKLYSSFGFKQG